MNFSQFLAVVRARWLLGLLVLVATTAVGLLYSLQSDKVYTATASVMLDAVQPDMPAGFGYGGGALAPTYIATQVDLIGSERVVLKAIEILRLERDEGYRQAWAKSTKEQGDFKIWLADTLRKELDVRPSRESNIITIRFSATDAEFAAKVTNAFVQAYSDTSVALRVDPARQFRTLYEARAAESRAALEAAQARLSEHQRVHGMIASGPDGRIDLEGVRLSELNSQLVQLQALANESQSRRTEAGRRAESLSEVRGDPTVAQLRIDIAREESRMNELNQRLGEKHPQVEEQQALLAQLRQRLSSAIVNAAGSIGASDNVNRARLAQLQAQIDAQRAKVLTLKTTRDQAEVLLRDVESARQAYEAVLQRLNQTDLASRTAQTNVAVVQAASPPMRPSQPRTLLNTIAAALAGIVLGLSTIVFSEIRDRRVRTGDEILLDMQQPLLVALPKVKFLANDTPPPVPRRFASSSGGLMASASTPRRERSRRESSRSVASRSDTSRSVASRSSDTSRSSDASRSEDSKRDDSKREDNA